jgi:hypothetical protein
MSSALWDPLYFAFDGAIANQVTGVVFTLVLAPCMASWLLWPQKWTALLSILAMLAWIFVGIIGSGIDV